jgi:hypothetical protein
MTKVDQLTKAAASLDDAQLDELIAIARYLSSAPLYESLSPQARASIAQGEIEHARGESRPANEVFERLKRKIDSARS